MSVDGALVLTAFVVDVLIWAPVHNVRFGGTAAATVINVAGVFAALSLVWRRRRPLLVFAICWTCGLLPLAVPGHEPFAALAISLFALGSLCAMRASVAALVLSLVPLGINTYNTVYTNGNQSLTGLVAVGTVWALVGVVAWGIGRFVFLARQRAELQQREHVLKEGAAVTRERLRLARELHDIVANSVGTMIVQAGVTRAMSPSAEPSVIRGLRTIESTGSQAMLELHRLLALLRSVDEVDTNDDLGSAVSLNDVERLLDDARSCDVSVSFSTTGVPVALDRRADHVAYRVIQECLANIIKHGGSRPHAMVGLQWGPGSLAISVWNDRRAPATDGLATSGFGLQGLAERLSELGGELSAGPKRDGYEVRSVIRVVDTSDPVAHGQPIGSATDTFSRERRGGRPR